VDTQLIFNDGGSTAAGANIYYNKTSDLVTFIDDVLVDNTGNLTINNGAVYYTTPHVHYYAISGDVFRPQVGPSDYACGVDAIGGCYVLSGQPNLYKRMLVTGVNLPHGAKVTGLYVRFYDIAAEDLMVQLHEHRTWEAGGNEYSMLSVTSAGVTGHDWVEDTSVNGSGEIVNELTGDHTNFQGNAYRVKIRPPGAGDWPTDEGWLRVLGVHITYEISRAP